MDRKFVAFVAPPRTTSAVIRSLPLLAALVIAPSHAMPITTCCGAADTGQYLRAAGGRGAAAERFAQHPARWFLADSALPAPVDLRPGAAGSHRALPIVADSRRGVVRAVPEPATWSLLIGVAALLAYRQCYGVEGRQRRWRSWRAVCRHGARRIARLLRTTARQPLRGA